MIPRPYQEDALAALHEHICTKKTNPCVVIPTGGGKSPCMAWQIERWRKVAPWYRCCILAHRKELIEQNAAELHTICPELEVGIFSAGLKQKDFNVDILIASIDSIYQRSGEFRPWDTLFIDEAHRIPFSGEGKYRTFIKGSERFNPRLRTIGWTATPFRMSGGALCHPDHILNEICYEAKVTDLIRDGYLCDLRTKIGSTQPNLEDVRRKSRGDYLLKSLVKATNRESVVFAAVGEIVAIIEAEQRKSVLVFCVDIQHCEMVSRAFSVYGIQTPFVTANTKAVERDKIVRMFKACKVRVVCNVNVYTEGFNAPNVDCIVLLRPTLSPGLFSQMVGRGLRIGVNYTPGQQIREGNPRRISQQKLDCLVLDFAGCIDEHGPIDLLGDERTVLAICSICRESFSRSIKTCPACGTPLPKIEIERVEQVEKERRLHGKKASQKAILSGVPMTLKVDQVFVTRHTKPGSPDSLRVSYRCGVDVYREWIGLDHPERFGKYAQRWWRERFGEDEKYVTVDNALGDLFTESHLLAWTKTITVIKAGKYWNITDYNKPLEEAIRA